jgi:NAD(P)H-hydrate epimerase
LKAVFDEPVKSAHCIDGKSIITVYLNPLHSMFVTVKQMVSAERRAIEKLLIPSRSLMFNAGKSVADLIRQEFPTLRSIGVAAGYGNNGGDGFVAGLLLSDHVSHVNIFSLGAREAFSPDSRFFLDRCFEKKNIRITFSDVYAVQTCDLIVDGLLGTGFHLPLRDPLLSVISGLNCGCPVVAVDIPSGLHGDTGQVAEQCIRAVHTVTFARAKVGMRDRSEYTGRITVADIGIPDICFDDSR